MLIKYWLSVFQGFQKYLHSLVALEPIAGGRVSSTLLTLFVVLTMYGFFARRTGLGVGSHLARRLL
jgi:hypothetical protein